MNKALLLLVVCLLSFIEIWSIETIKIRGLQKADYSLAILDSSISERNGESDLCSTVLLHSEFPSKVEDSKWYFDSIDRRKSHLGMEALMLTQGWSRYEIPDVMEGVYSDPASCLEIGPSIGGQARSRWQGNPLKNTRVQVFMPSLVYVDEVRTDDEGRFSFTNRDYPEETQMIVQVINDKGSYECNFDMDATHYPKVEALPSGCLDFKPDQVIADVPDYEWRISHSDGMMSIMLGEVTVVQMKPYGNSDNELYSNLARAEIDYKRLEREKVTSYEEAFRKLPGVIVQNGGVSYRGKAIEFWIDGTRWEMVGADGVALGFSGQPNAMKLMTPDGTAMPEPDPMSYQSTSSPFKELEMQYPMQMIKTIQFFQPTMSLIFSTSSAMQGGVISLTTKTGSELIRYPDWRHRVITPLGYQRKKTIYTPKYELMDDDELNARPTLYWIPRAEFGADGRLSLPIPPSVSESYVVVEGLTPDGTLVSYSEKIKR